MQESTQEATQFPPLSKDTAFYGMAITQFLGAFNDNLYKQLVLILCIVAGGQQGKDNQPRAMAVFAFQFVLFSGIAGFLADRYSKRTIIIVCKYAEMLIVLLGMISFFMHSLVASVIVLGLMGVHSAFFGPAKYGILPEMIDDRDLPPANGVIQMTTFLAIIFGTAGAGYLADSFPNELWKGSIACLVIAAIGVVTSHLVRRTPVAQPNLVFNKRSFVIAPEAWRLVTGDKELLAAIVVYSTFWFIGGLVQPAVNAYGEVQMNWDKTTYSSMIGCLGFGIAGGCVIAGLMSKGFVNFRLAKLGLWGMIITLICMSGIGTLKNAAGDVKIPELSIKYLSAATLTLMGIAAGLFAVPLQVFLQARPPKDKKGQVIGAMNLFTWIGIILSAVFYEIVKNQIFPHFHVPISALFFVTAMCLIPIAFIYRPKNTALTDKKSIEAFA